jgi:hypothetical protein
VGRGFLLGSANSSRVCSCGKTDAANHTLRNASSRCPDRRATRDGGEADSGALPDIDRALQGVQHRRATRQVRVSLHDPLGRRRSGKASRVTVETRLAVVIASLVGLILLALLVRQERRLRKQRGRLELPPLPKRKKKVVAAPPVPEVQVSELYPDLPAEHVLARCPMVDMLGESSPLRDWLRHFAGVDAWPLVVERFYERAAHEPLITDYFRDVDMNKLQRHFLAV